MKFYSTNKKSNPISFKEAIFQGLAPDGGLYMPEVILVLPKSFFINISSLSLQEIAIGVTDAFLEHEIPKSSLTEIVAKACDFDVPLVHLEKNLSILELFHGPTMAFKDFGAKFMAQLFSYYKGQLDKQLTILVATSGDTGAAVAAGFYNIPGIDVVLLYPKGRVSKEQEELLAKWGGNIQAFEVEGTFDDCQKFVKQAFADTDIQKKRLLTSANSINIARLLPQMFYYFYAYGKVDTRIPVVFSVPSGNFGNITAGLFAKRMGLPIYIFIAAVNANDVFPTFLKTGTFTPKPSKHTISNAMDIGNPSNFARILDLYSNNGSRIRNDVWSQSFSDTQTKQAMQQVYNMYRYILDPHGAVAYLGVKDYQKQNKDVLQYIFLETAHPAKFKDTVEDILQTNITMPKQLTMFAHKKSNTQTIPNSYSAFKQYLL